MTRMNVSHSPGDHFIIPDRVFVKKEKDKMWQREEKNLPPKEHRGIKNIIYKEMWQWNQLLKWSTREKCMYFELHVWKFAHWIII